MSSKAFPIDYPFVLPIMEQFYTLQGEGRYAGYPAYFVRLAGCDVGCVWCDVKESWTVSPEQWMSIDDIVNKILESPTKIVVITGGEPAMYDLNPLTALLKEKGLQIHLETSGAYPLKGKFDWITVSPKKFKSPLQEVVSQAHELKVVIFHHSDFLWAEKNAKMTNSSCVLLLQSEWSKKNKFYTSLIDYIKTHPQWSLSVQTHKYLDIP
ncbi:MAG: 7-carboxy-7-deazaguanine synthase QueE [Chitinophagales bacterium]|nr:7-carboxy-7-deazaguanine synthase QueE [Chitinophagales bacterium]